MSCRNVWYRLFGSTTGQQFSQTNADKVSLSESEDVVDFRKKVYQKNSSILTGLDSSHLIVYANESAFMKRNSEDDTKEEPLKEDSLIGTLGTSINEALLVVVPSISPSELNGPNLFVTQQIKRAISSTDWFPTEFSKRAKLKPGDELEDEQEELLLDERMTKYFRMKKLPPLAHSQDKYKLIVERDCYARVYKIVLERAKDRLSHGWGTSMHVSGNPGIGKSRFYLYFIFCLLMEGDFISKYKLVINFETKYFQYDSRNKEFISLNIDQVTELQEDLSVFRLIEGNSDKLTGWKGVCVLFASPGVTGLNNFLKIDSYSFYLPIWTFDEIKELNEMLDAPLAENWLIERFSIVGGIPRSIFTDAFTDEEAKTTGAIHSFDALHVISYIQGMNVREETLNHRVLCMVPREDFRIVTHLDFVSKYAAEKVVEKVADDCIHDLTSFAIKNSSDDSGMTAVIRGRIYEMLCHRHVKRGGLVLPFQPLGINHDAIYVDVPKEVKVLPFAKLDDIPLDLNGFVYCQPSSSTFGALDSFILDFDKKQCFGLQMTINKNHGIKYKPLDTFLCWLKTNMGIGLTGFYFGFMVPNDIAGDFSRQTFLTTANTVHKLPENLADMMQCVVPFAALKN